MCEKKEEAHARERPGGAFWDFLKNKNKNSWHDVPRSCGFGESVRREHWERTYECFSCIQKDIVIWKNLSGGAFYLVNRLVGCVK